MKLVTLMCLGFRLGIDWPEIGHVSPRYFVKTENLDFFQPFLSAVSCFRLCAQCFFYRRYELDFLAVIREKKVDATLEEIKNYVTYSTANCIGKLIEILISRNPHDLECWLLNLKFCQKMRDSTALLKVGTRHDYGL